MNPIQNNNSIHTPDASSAHKRPFRHLIPPALYLLFNVILFCSFPITSTLRPTALSRLSDIETLYKKGDAYITVTLHHLKFTGYTQTRHNRTAGYFYYYQDPERRKAYIVLLDPDTCQNGLAQIEETSIRGKILGSDDAYDALLTQLADDLSWTQDGIRSKINPCYISEPDFRHLPSLILLAVLTGGSLMALGSIWVTLWHFFRKKAKQFPAT